MSKKNNKIVAQTKNTKQVKKTPAKKDAQKVIEDQPIVSIDSATDNIVEVAETIDPINEELIPQTEPVEETILEVETAETIEPVILPEENIVPAQDEVVAEPTKKKSKRKDMNFEPLVGCSYHMHRKFLKKLFSKNEVVVRFVKSEVGYNGHLEVPAADKQKAIALLETFKVDNPTIKNLYWALNLTK